MQSLANLCVQRTEYKLRQPFRNRPQLQFNRNGSLARKLILLVQNQMFVLRAISEHNKLQHSSDINSLERTRFIAFESSK